MRALPQRARALRNLIGKAHTQTFDPFQAVVCVVCQCFNEVEVCSFIAAVPRLQSVPFFRIEQIFASVCFISVPLSSYRFLKGCVFGACRFFSKCGFDCRFYRIGHRNLFLQFFVGRIVDGAAYERVAADFARFFNDDDRFAFLTGCDCSCQSRAAAAYNDDIRARVRRSFSGFLLFAPVGHVCTRLL